MKKFLKTTAKKSMALFMTVVMLMSCWVFIAPEEHQAEAYTEIGNVLNATQLESFKTYIGASSVSTAVTLANVSNRAIFTDDGAKNYSSYFANALYVGTAKAQLSKGSYTLSDNAIQSLALYFPYTVLVDDGTSTSKIPVTLVFDSHNDCQVFHWGTGISGSGFSLANSNWYGGIDGSSNGKFYDVINSSNQKCGKTSASADVDEGSYYAPSKNGWACVANIIQYNGRLGTDYSSASYSTTLSPAFSSHFSQAKNCGSYKGDTKNISLGTATNSIAVINIVPWKTAIEHAANQYKNILNNGESRYTAESIANFKTYAANLFNVGPNKYFDSNVTSDDLAKKAVTNFADNNKKAVTDYYANGQLVEATFTVTFEDYDGRNLKTQTGIAYGGSATAPANPSRKFDATHHYTFSGWSAAFNNVTGDITVKAQYTATAHTHTGAFSYKDGTHAQKCSGCSSVGWNGTDNVWEPCNGTWGGTDASHTKPCSVCGNTQTHTPTWVDNDDDVKYQVPFDQSTYNSCLTDILYYKSCSICGQAHSSATFVGVAARGYHVYDTFTGHTNHTCTEDGYDTYLCSGCGKATTKRYDTVNGQPGTDPAKHNWNNKLAVYSDAQHGYQCRDCSEWDTSSLVSHTYAEPSGSSITTRPTCYQPGEGIFKCGCGHSYVGSIPATGNHNWNTRLEKIDDNTHGYRCRVTGCPAYQVASDGTEKHVWTLTSTITAPTCSADGRGNYKCNLCGATKEDVIENTGDEHAYGEIVYIDENTHGKVCAYNNAHTIEVADHTYAAFEDETHDKLLPTCSAEGYHYEKCAGCDHVKMVTDAAVADAHAYGEIVDLGDGTHGKVCAHNDAHKIEVEEHKWTLASTITAPTCSAVGSGNYECTVCDATKVDEIAKDPDAHAYGEIVYIDENTHGKVCAYDATHTVEVADHTYAAFEDATHDKLLPTCMAEGYHYEKCAGCGHIKKVTDAVVADAHAYGEIVDLGDGTHGRVCAHNDDHKTDVVAHDYKKIVDDAHPEVIATCVAEGSHWEKCSVCGCEKQVTDPIDEDNHLISAAQSNGDGTHTAACERPGCPEEATQNCKDTDADKNCVCDVCGYNIPHIYDKEVATAEYWMSDATCTDKAVYYYSCQCGKTSKGTSAEATFEYGEALGHDYTEASDVVRSEKTCLADQTNWYGCSRCDANAQNDPEATDKYYDVAGTKLDHSYTGAIKNNGNGTHSYLCVNGCNQYGGTVDCSNFGSYTYDENNHYRECLDCGYTETEAHALTDWAPAATAGKHIKECKKCEYVLVGDCDYKVIDKVVPNCMAGGHTTYECQYCKHAYTDNFGKDSTNHTGNNHFENGYAATCSKEGYEGDIVCECGVTVGQGQIIPKDPANHGDNTEHIEGYVEATCIVAGHTGATICDGCGEVKIPDRNIGIDKNNHKNTTKYDELKPTCEEAGHTAYEICNDCNKTISQKITLAATGHDYSGDPVVVEYGKHSFECINGCGTTGVGKEKGATEDCFGGEATCTDPAICAVCAQEYAVALGHDFSADKDRANQLEAGYHNYKCSRCDVYGIVENDAQIVDGKIACFDEHPVRTGASCTEYAYYTHTCDTCGYKWVIVGTSDEDAPIGHDYTAQFLDSEHRISYATCTEKAVYWYDCSRCTKNAKDETDTDRYTGLTYEYGEPLGHKFDGKVKIDEAELASIANCTQNAKYYVYCTVCKASSKGTDDEATFEDYGSKGEHAYEEVATADFLKSAATCTAKAVYYKSCKGCGAASKQTFTYGETAPHVYTEQIKDAAHMETKADCITAATYWYDCANCAYNAKFEDQTDMTAEEIAALMYTDGGINENNHTNLINVAVKNPTCDEEGHSAYKVCEGCGDEFGKTVYPTTTHDFRGVAKYYDDDTHNFACVNCDAYGNDGVEDAKVACTFGSWVQDKDAEGKPIHTKKCSCGNSKQGDCLDAEPQIVAPTCKADGYTAHTCDLCGNKWTTDPTPKAEHSVPDTWTSNGNGTHSRKCANCDEGETGFCEGGTATCQAAAVCTICNTAYGSKIDHIAGEWIDDPARPATCYANKWQTTTCTMCPEKLEKEIVGSAFTSHDMSGGWVITTEPTCAAEGEQEKRCQHTWTINGTEIQCDYTETMIIPAVKDAHVWSDWKEIGGDCSTGIKQERECTVCHATESRKINAADHSFENVVIIHPTCDEDGYIKKVCTKCKYIEEVFSDDDESLKATGHNFEKNAAATTVCVEVQTCKNCGESKSTPIGTDVPGAHKWVVFAGSQPTCAYDGYTDYYHCTSCGAEKGYTTIPKLDHYDNDGDGKCDDCKGHYFDVKPDDSGKDCDCMCHKTSGFMQFIYKIVRFFWKLFGISKTCDCGASHY